MNKMSQLSKAIVPYVGMERIIDTLGATYKKGTKEISLNELASLLNCSISNINNVTPTLNILELADVESGVMTLTNNGMEFIRTHSSKELEIAKGIIKKGILKNEVLKFVKSLLDTRVQVTGEEIGKAISDRFGKRWKSVMTYRAHGNSCASILSFAGFGHYYNGVLSLKPLTKKAENVLYAPEIGFRPIICLLKALYPFAKAKSSDLTKKLNRKGSRINSELSVCVILNLVEKDSVGGYSITKAGRRLIDPHLPHEERKRIFMECLMNSPYADAISKLSHIDREMTYEDVGGNLEYDLRRDWTQLTKKIYGKKFITWLNAAGLVDKIGPNKFRLKTLEIREAAEDRDEKTEVADVSQIYEIAKNLGILETLVPEEKNKKTFEDKVSVLKSLLNKHTDLELVFELLRKNFHLSIENENNSIYKANIQYVSEKIREKLGLAMN